MSVFGVPEGSAKPALPPEVLMEKYPPSALKTAPLKDDRSLSEGQISKEFKTSVQAPDYPLNSSQEKMIIQSIYDNNYPDSAERLLHFIENSPYRSSKELAQQYYASLENKTSSFMQSQNEKIKSKAINMAAEEDKVKELLGSENLPSNYKEILGITEEAKLKAALGIPDNVSLPENYKEILQMTDKDKVKMALKIPPNVKLRDDYKQNETVKIRFGARKRYIQKTFSTSTQTISSSYIPFSSGSYSIIDMATNESVVPFSSYTTMSCDTVSNYFKQDLNAFEPNRAYKILIKVNHNDGQEIIYDNDFEFILRT